MKEADVDKLAQNLQGLVDAAQRERVVLTRKGKPIAMIVGVGNKDAEDLYYESSPEFWKMIQERRQEKGGIPLEELEARLCKEEARLKRAARKRRKKT